MWTSKPCPDFPLCMVMGDLYCSCRPCIDTTALWMRGAHLLVTRVRVNVLRLRAGESAGSPCSCHGHQLARGGPPITTCETGTVVLLPPGMLWGSTVLEVSVLAGSKPWPTDRSQKLALLAARAYRASCVPTDTENSGAGLRPQVASSGTQTPWRVGPR